MWFSLKYTNDITISNLARKIIELTGSSSEIVYIPYEKAYGEGFEDMQRRKPNIEKMFKMFRWQPRHSLDDTLRRVIEYEQDLAKRPEG